MEAYKKAKEAVSGGAEGNDDESDVDMDRRFYTDANSLGFTDHKPSKEAVDRLVEDTKKRFLALKIALTIGKPRKRQNDGKNVKVKMQTFHISISVTKFLTKSWHGASTARSLF
jgi:hypothetical protein